MDDWGSYRLSDFLLFTRQTYFRLFEIYNHDIWPLPLLAPGLAMIMLALVLRGRRYQGQVIAMLLALMWLWVGWAYHLQRYATINWAASAFAVLFLVQALLLAWYGLARRPAFAVGRHTSQRLGIALSVYALVLHPLLAPLLHGNWARAELVGLAPDPTAIFTLGLLLLSRKRNSLLWVIPLLWCGLSAVVLFAMASAQAWAPALAAGLTVVAMSSLGRQSRRRMRTGE